jgi:hypothetical protein
MLLHCNKTGRLLAGGHSRSGSKQLIRLDPWTGVQRSVQCRSGNDDMSWEDKLAFERVCALAHTHIHTHIHT